uniref:Uncharacterized protein n=1 Tax=Anguilla anguilla TaxID=7936 RepID=A0A0E9X511_ANGAN
MQILFFNPRIWGHSHISVGLLMRRLLKKKPFWERLGEQPQTANTIKKWARTLTCNDFWKRTQSLKAHMRHIFSENIRIAALQPHSDAVPLSPYMMHPFLPYDTQSITAVRYQCFWVSGNIVV